MDFDVGTVLVPVDGSDESAEAARYAVAVADRYGAALHALYVIGETTARAIEAGDVTVSEVADENRAFIGDVREMAVGDAGEDRVPVETSTAYAFSTARKLHHPGSVILDCAASVDADFLVVPRESTTSPSPGTLEKAAEYVLLYASQPVLSV